MRCLPKQKLVIVIFLVLHGMKKTHDNVDGSCKVPSWNFMKGLHMNCTRLTFYSAQYFLTLNLCAQYFSRKINEGKSLSFIKWNLCPHWQGDWGPLNGRGGGDRCEYHGIKTNYNFDIIFSV